MSSHLRDTTLDMSLLNIGRESLPANGLFSWFKTNERTKFNSLNQPGPSDGH